jgi:hypothetical protein
MAGDDHGGGGRATLRSLAEPDNGVLVHFGCRGHVAVQLEDGFWAEAHTLRRHYGLSILASVALQRWGAETTLDDLERRAVCSVCGARAPKARVTIHVPSPPAPITGMHARPSA